MKANLLTTIALLTTFAVPAISGPFGLPDHERNGWRDTGCEEGASVEFKDAGGNVLYQNNLTCPNGQGGMDADHPAGGKAFGAGSAHKVFPHDFQHGRACDTRQDGCLHYRQRQRWQQ